MTRNIKVYLCQEPAIVSKPAETRQTSDSISESPVFLFRTRIDRTLEKAKATLQGYSPDFQIPIFGRYGSAALKRPVLPLALSFGSSPEWPTSNPTCFALIKRVSLDLMLSKRLTFSTFNHFRLSLLPMIGLVSPFTASYTYAEARALKRF
jgi:hypothetical protein